MALIRIETPNYIRENYGAFPSPVKRYVGGPHDGRHVHVVQMLYTAGLVVSDPISLCHRWCYETRREARMAFDAWDGEGDPPGNWIKYKGPPRERHGPGSTVPEAFRE
jgi:hypothetical protein